MFASNISCCATDATSRSSSDHPSLTVVVSPDLLLDIYSVHAPLRLCAFLPGPSGPAEIHRDGNEGGRYQYKLKGLVTHHWGGSKCKVPIKQPPTHVRESTQGGATPPP